MVKNFTFPWYQAVKIRFKYSLPSTLIVRKSMEGLLKKRRCNYNAQQYAVKID